jgi:hypothetical protein
MRQLIVGRSGRTCGRCRGRILREEERRRSEGLLVEIKRFIFLDVNKLRVAVVYDHQKMRHSTFGHPTVE